MTYKPLPTKGDITPESGLIQAAYALDAAAGVAERMNDVEGLLNISAMWIKLSRDFDEFASSVYPPHEDHAQTKIQTGFQRGGIQAEEEDQDAGIE